MQPQPSNHPTQPGAPGPPIRTAQTSDLDELVRLEQACFGTDAWSWQVLLEETTGANRAYFVIDGAKGRLVGAAGIALGKDFAEVMTVEVDPMAQGHGLGRALMDRLIDTAAQAGLGRVLLEVAENNDAAVRLYASMGFEVIGFRKGYYQPSNQNALVMELTIAP